MQLTGFEPRPSDVRSDCSTNRAITTAQRVNFDIYYLQFNYSRVTRLGNVDVVSLTDDETAVGLVIVANFRHFNGADVFFLVSARFEPWITEMGIAAHHEKGKGSCEGSVMCVHE